VGFVIRLAVFCLVLPLSAHARQDVSGGFEKLATDAAAARQANDLPKAADLYSRALAENPKWEEGWWSLGSVLYDANQYARAADALTKLVELNPKAAPGWGLLGLCEFETGPADKSLQDIERGLTLGLPGQDQMDGVLRYHEALLLTHERDFDTALQKYAWFVQRGVHHDTLLESLGLAALRHPIYPEAMPAEQRDVTLAAGKAAFLSMSGHTSEAQQSFRDLAERYASTPGVHYLYGTMLMGTDPERGVAEMRRELEISPSNGAANATVAWMLMEDDDFADARPLARKSEEEEPQLPLAHYVYGRSLVEEGKLSEGIEQLETAVKMSPDVLIHHVALAAAYSKAARPENARRERLLAMKMAKEEHAATAP
jgi:tetratricopeptide (TPR) repeat protein